MLIIDDDVLILAALERQLAGGHDVVAVEDPAAALAQIRGGATFDVILCDLRMPSMTGVQFHAALVRDAPRLAQRIVLMTGGRSRRDTAELDDEAARIPTLAKPFDVETLRRMIEQITAA